VRVTRRTSDQQCACCNDPVADELPSLRDVVGSQLVSHSGSDRLSDFEDGDKFSSQLWSRTHSAEKPIDVLSRSAPRLDRYVNTYALPKRVKHAVEEIEHGAPSILSGMHDDESRWICLPQILKSETPAHDRVTVYEQDCPRDEGPLGATKPRYIA
jgi:hypothetical protein